MLARDIGGFGGGTATIPCGPRGVLASLRARQRHGEALCSADPGEKTPVKKRGWTGAAGSPAFAQPERKDPPRGGRTSRFLIGRDFCAGPSRDSATPRTWPKIQRPRGSSDGADEIS